jgi:hypothetical protein
LDLSGLYGYGKIARNAKSELYVGVVVHAGELELQNVSRMMLK